MIHGYKKFQYVLPATVATFTTPWEKGSGSSGSSNTPAQMFKTMKVGDIQTREPFKSLMPFDARSYKYIVEHMRKNGYDHGRPIIMWKEGNCILDGHMRLNAAIECGIKEVSVSEKSFLSEEDAFYFQIKCQTLRHQLTPEEIFRLENLNALWARRLKK